SLILHPLLPLIPLRQAIVQQPLIQKHPLFRDNIGVGLIGKIKNIGNVTRVFIRAVGFDDDG
ncbi:MAG: hypothetical protein KAR32_12850, partial [Candidatus Omnitrophica bacterium]|nr:hypothetical protein [Candidatus Omnitrophota bacterium]